MSYEPTIIVEKKDLVAIEEEMIKAAVKGDTVPEYLLRIIEQDSPCLFKKMNLYIFQPEYTNFNMKVRDFLTDNDVEYGIDN